MDEAAIIAAFLARFEADRESGQSRTIADYQQQFPGFEAVIAREFENVAAPAAPELSTVGTGDSRFDLGQLVPEARLGRFRILRPLARGGQAEVYLAEDEQLGRRVALKVLRGLGPYTQDLLRRFRREAEVTSRLDHPGICTVHDSGSEGGLAWIAMRFVDGRTMAQEIADAAARGEVPGKAVVLRAVGLVERAARALHAAHEAGILHRDIKPSNVMVTPRAEPILLDFGLATDFAGDSTVLTQSGDRFGTPAYMSPEQVAGDPARLDRRTDVWSLGVTLYELLALERPFQGQTREALYEAIRLVEPVDLRRRNPSVPRDLAVVVATALEKDCDRRYATALDFAEDLRRFREHEPVLARPVSLLGRLARWAKRRPARAALAAVLAVGLPAFAALASYTVATRPLVLERRRLAEAEAVEALLERAFFDAGHGSLGSAETGFEKVLTHEGDHPEAIAGLAYAALQTHEPARALVALDRFPGVVERHPELLRLRSEVLGMLGRKDEAAQLRSAAFEPHSALGFFLSGLREIGRGHFQNRREGFVQAVAEFDHAVTASPSARALYHFELLHAAGHAGDTRVAERAALAVAQLWPDSIGGLRWTAFAFAETDSARATAANRRLLELAPKDGQAWAIVGNELRGRGETAAAEAAYRKAITFRPELSTAHDGLGVCLQDQGLHDQAVAEHRRAIELDPRRPEPALNLGVALRQAGKGDEALLAMQKAATLGPELPGAHCGFAHELRLHGRPAEAEPEYRRALELRPGWGNALLGLAASVAELSRTGEALELLGSGLPFAQPNDAPSLRAVARVLARERRFDDLVPLQTRLCELLPKSAREWTALGRLHFERKRLADALPALRTAIELDPSFAEISNDLGCALSELGQPAEAAVAFGKATELGNDFAEAWIGLSTELRQLGRFRDARDAIARADELGSQRPGWPHATGAALAAMEAAVLIAESLDERLALEPASMAYGGLIELAGIAQASGRFAAAVERFEAAETKEAPLFRRGKSRAVRSAARAAVSASLAADAGDVALRKRYRGLALRWLEDELRAIESAVESDRGRDQDARVLLDYLQHATAFEAVRGTAELETLPVDERVLWTGFWQRVAALRQDVD